jgi:hypothetical protein
MPFPPTTNQPPAPVQPSVNPGFTNRFITDPTIGGGQISTAVLPLASAVAPGTPAYDATLGPVFSNGSAWIPVGSSLASTIKASVAAAAAANPVTTQPLIAPAAWVTATAYAAGQAVTNAGNCYICNIAIASSATAPTLTTNAPQTDGSGSWYYFGPSFTSSPLAPTVTVTGTRYSSGIFYSNTNNAASLGAVNIRDSTNFILSPGVDGGGVNNSYFWTSGTLGSAQFVTDAPQLQIVVSATVNPGLCVYVGTPGGALAPVSLGIIAPDPSGFNYYQLVFADRRQRQFLVEMPSGVVSSGIQNFYGVLCNDTVSKVSAPSPSSFTMSLVGTSYLAGNATLYPTSALGIGPQIAKLLGCTSYWVDQAGGGTGYVQAGVGGIFANPVRLAAMVATNPQLLLITGGGINDIGAATITGAVGGASGAAALAIEQAAVLSYLKAVRAALPGVLMIVIGSEAGSTGPSASIINMETAVANAVAQFADRYCFYIAQSGSPAQKSWISGTGTVAATNGSGNSDVYVSSDAIHTVMGGSNYLAAKSANAIRQVINGLT